MKPVAVLLCALAVTSASQAGNLYKWVDENGVTVYSQSPPPAKPAEKVKPPPPPATDPEQAAAALDERIEKLNEAQQQREQSAEDAAQQRSEQDQRNQACESAKQRQAELNSGPPRYLLQEPDGSTRRLDYEELEKMRAKAAQRVKENCDGS